MSMGRGVIFAEGFDDAFVGLARRFGIYEPVATYDYDKCITILMERDSMSHAEAIEFFEYNVIGSWVGDRTPVFVHPHSMEDLNALD